MILNNNNSSNKMIYYRIGKEFLNLPKIIDFNKA